MLKFMLIPINFVFQKYMVMMPPLYSLLFSKTPIYGIDPKIFIMTTKLSLFTHNYHLVSLCKFRSIISIISLWGKTKGSRGRVLIYSSTISVSFENVLPSLDMGSLYFRCLLVVFVLGLKSSISSTEILQN